ncbi:unnamed protein product, partial [Iphiclides podalirius]
MFMDCFGLLLSHLEGAATERLICATCVSRLREATAFRHQVLLCEERLLSAKIQLHNEDGEPHDEVKFVLDVKEEKDIDQENADVENYDGDNIHNDVDEVTTPPARPTRGSQKKKSLRAKRGTKPNAEEETASKRELMMRIQKMRKKMEEYEEKGSTRNAVAAQPDSDSMAHENTITIVECSYVCPFDTSFSDYYCVYCRQQFTDPVELRAHTMGHDPSAYKRLPRKKTAQVDVYRIDCRLCPQPVATLDELRGHVAAHGKRLHPTASDFLPFRLTGGRLTCTECPASFGFFHALKKHMAVHFGACVCDVCGAHYFHERMLALHQRGHREGGERHPCPDCGKLFRSKHNRYLHVARAHRQEPAYPCPKCDEVLFTYTLRYRHLIEAHGDVRRFQCELCERAYDSRKSLREHNRRSHLKIMRHQCDLCEKRFYLPSRLREHMAAHSGERNYRCECCGKSYPRLRGLKVHMQTHSAEKKYRCALCSASFTQNVNLKNHMKRQHQSLEPEEALAGY